MNEKLNKAANIVGTISSIIALIVVCTSILEHKPLYLFCGTAWFGVELLFKIVRSNYQ